MKKNEIYLFLVGSRLLKLYFTPLKTSGE